MRGHGDRIHQIDWGIGDTVRIDDDPVLCRVTAVQIRGNGHTYELSWMTNGEPRTAWVESWRLTAPAIEAVGFHATTWRPLMLVINLILIIVPASVSAMHFYKLGHSHGCIDTWRIVIAQRGVVEPIDAPSAGDIA